MRATRARFFFAIAVALTACYSPAAPTGAPCKTDSNCPSGQTCDPDELVCGGPSELRTHIDDTAQDFGAAGAYVDEVTIEPEGFVGPVGYLVGHVRLTGVNSYAVRDSMTPWNEVAAAPRTTSTLLRGTQLVLAPPPEALGLSDGDKTVLVEGEIFLDTTGTWRFRLNADDLGFFELAAPGVPSFTRVVADASTGTNGMYMVTTAGWHRFRGAFSENSADMQYVLTHDRPGGSTSNYVSVPYANVRAPAGDVRGVLVEGFEEPFLIGPVASVIHTDTLASQTFSAQPYGIPTGSGSFSLRYGAQVLIDVEDDYSFRVDTGQGHRVWLGGVLVADKFGAAASVTVTTPTRLERGWHNLVIDMNRLPGGPSPRVDVRIEGGPGAGAAIPADHMRPIVGRATRWTGRYAAPGVTLPDQGNATELLEVDQPPGFVPSRVDVFFEVDHDALSTLSVELDLPGGTTTTLASQGSISDTGPRPYHGRSVVTPAVGGRSWSFRVIDNALDMIVNAEFLGAGVTIIGSAGPAPFPTGYRYVSAPRDLGEVASYTHVRWTLRQARPDTGVIVSLRTCEDAAACGAEAWTVVKEGVRPMVAPRRFAQYMVELTSNGDVPTALDSVEIGYRAYQGK